MRRRCPSFTPRPPILAQAQGWERAVLWFAPKTCFAAKLSGAKIAQEMTWCKATQRRLTEICCMKICKFGAATTSWLICGQVYSGGFRGVGWQPWLDMTAAGHPSTSSTTDHHAIIMPGLTLCTRVYNVALLGVEWGASQVIKLIAWGRMSSCNVPSPDTSSLSLASRQLYHLPLLISFWLNWLSPLSPLHLQIIVMEHCLNSLLGFDPQVLP